MWPQGYMDLAKSAGLSEGVDLKAGDSISRAILPAPIGPNKARLGIAVQSDGGGRGSVRNKADHLLLVIKDQVTPLALEGGDIGVAMGGEKRLGVLIAGGADGSLGGATTVDSDAVVVMGNATAATFHHLTGGVTNFSIMKDRQIIRMNQIKPYDVATYDPITNTLVVSPNTW